MGNPDPIWDKIKVESFSLLFKKTVEITERAI